MNFLIAKLAETVQKNFCMRKTYTKSYMFCIIRHLRIVKLSLGEIRYENVLNISN
jgi:hypothetical protein